MDRISAVLRVAELALAEARKALRIIARKAGPQGPKGEDGPAGPPGPDGPPGLGFDDLEIVGEDGGRVIVFRCKRGDRVREFRVVTAIPVHRGVYRSEQRYLPGDTASYGGSTWHCNEATSDKPDGANHSLWTLSVKRGRDGRASRETGVKREPS